MAKIVVSYSPEVGGSSVVSLMNAFKDVGGEIINADFRAMMDAFSEADFNRLYSTAEGRSQLFAHAKAMARLALAEADVLAIPGNSAMVDPALFHQERCETDRYDFSRTIVEMALTHVATEKGMPVIGVCGGHQVIAVYGGGVLADLSIPQIEKQKMMDYDATSVEKDSLLSTILFKKNHREKALDKQYFFGAHFQIVKKLAKGFKGTATASDEESNEASESLHGVPVITTQFHPEIAVQGLPGVKFIYQPSPEEAKAQSNIFSFMNGAGEAYRARVRLLQEFKSLLGPSEQDLVPSEMNLPKPGAKFIAAKVPKEKKKNLAALSNFLGALCLCSIAILLSLSALASPLGLLPIVFAASIGIVSGVSTLVCLNESNGVAERVYDYSTYLIGSLLALIGTPLRAFFSMIMTQKTINTLEEKQQLKATKAGNHRKTSVEPTSPLSHLHHKEVKKAPYQLFNDTPAQHYPPLFSAFKESTHTKGIGNSATKPAVNSP